MDIIRKRQMESRLALRMEEMSKDENSGVIETKDTYEWMVNGKSILSVAKGK